MALPKRVRVVEVGPRDGFQMEAKWIPTELKKELVEILVGAGLQEIELTSFVRADVIPQMADAAELMDWARDRGDWARARGTGPSPDPSWIVLVPNTKGAELALARGARELRQVVCVTETYNQRNVGLAVDQSIERFRQIRERAKAAGASASVVLAAALGCPFEGRVSESWVVELAVRFAELGASAVGIADSAGLGNPLQCRRLSEAVLDALEVPVWLHLHDTRATGLANAWAGLEAGIDTFDTSFGGLGGCPVVKGATGNIATEDFVYLCHEMGIETGVDLDEVRRASRRIAEFLGRELPSRVLRSGTLDELVAQNG